MAAEFFGAQMQAKCPASHFSLVLPPFGKTAFANSVLIREDNRFALPLGTLQEGQTTFNGFYRFF